MDYSLTKTEWLQIKNWFNELLKTPPAVRDLRLAELTDDTHMRTIISTMLSLCESEDGQTGHSPEMKAVADLLNQADDGYDSTGTHRLTPPLPKHSLTLEQQPAMFRLLHNLLLISGGSPPRKDE